MQEPNFATTKWDLHPDVCPCDVQFNAWIAARGIVNRTIYHFGTGNHHVVGFTQAQNGSGNRVFGITASPEECASYMEESAKNPAVAKNYLCYFGDVYRTNAHLLPDFDVVTLFHLCEFYDPDSAKADTDLLDPAQVLDLMTGRTRVGGHILFYTKSRDFDRARPVIAAWEKSGAVERLDDFDLLRVYRKRG